MTFHVSLLRDTRSYFQNFYKRGGASYRYYALYKCIVIRHKGSIIQKNSKGQAQILKQHPQYCEMALNHMPLFPTVTI